MDGENCVCDEGFTLNEDHSDCIIILVDTPKCESCPEGQHCNANNDGCESCPENEHWNNSECVKCSDNLHWDENNKKCLCTDK